MGTAVRFGADGAKPTRCKLQDGVARAYDWTVAPTASGSSYRPALQHDDAAKQEQVSAKACLLWCHLATLAICRPGWAVQHDQPQLRSPCQHVSAQQKDLGILHALSSLQPHVWPS